MFGAAVRVLARAAAIQLEEAAAAHPKPPPSLLKGKGRAVPLRHERIVPETDLGVSAATTARGELEDTASAQITLGSTVDRQWEQGAPIQPIASTSSSKTRANTAAEAGPSRPIRSADAAPSAPPSMGQGRSSAPDLMDSSIRREVNASDRTSTPDVTFEPDAKPLIAAETSAPTVEQGPTEQSIPGEGSMTEPPATKIMVEEDDTPVMLRASKVPSSRIGRLFHYGSLAASMGWGAASEGLRRTAGGTAQGGSVFMSDANIRRLVATLGRMRGAALKLGQFMSIQDNHMLPPEIEKVLQQVQAHANYMPDWQMEKVMSTEFGADWQKLFSSFDRVPIASASIGQVHRATMASTGLPVAVKIQFPGIASSITSDLGNLSILLRSSALLPKGLYLQNTIAVMKRELEDECDYIREAESGRRFSRLLGGYDFFRVPKVVDEASSSKVLTVEWMEGKPLSRIKGLSQKARDQIGENTLRLCLLELFEFRFMQTDPNWANFLYDTNASKLGLIDFGASREYTKEFMDGWYRLLTSALKGDRQAMKEESENLGYLTGEENEMMVKAHLDSMALVASPFHHKGPYAFAQQTITSSVRSLIPIMLAHRLTPPPQETYSLNRKLSGAFLMCAKLESRVDCAKLWEEVVGNYKQGPA